MRLAVVAFTRVPKLRLGAHLRETLFSESLDAAVKLPIRHPLRILSRFQKSSKP